MNLFDERLKGAFGALLAGADVDTRRLSIEVKGGAVTITGTVPTLEQRRLLWSLLATADSKARDIECRVGVAAESADGTSLDLPGGGVPNTSDIPSRRA